MGQNHILPKFNQIYSIFHINEEGKEFLEFNEPEYAYAYYTKKRIDLLTGETQDYPILEWLASLDAHSLKENYHQPHVFHLFYDLGFIIQNLNSIIGDNTLLAVDIKYTNVDNFSLDVDNSSDWSLFDEPTLSEYENAFKAGYEHLVSGDCYQFNLTFPFSGAFKDKVPPRALAAKLWKEKENRGDFAHGTFIPYLKMFYLSNSPECLFQAETVNDGVKLWSKPIKGTISLQSDEAYQEAWDKLSNSKKDQAELYMITDLLRNDLAKIETPNAQIIHKKQPLRVPKILHQYSLIEVLLKKNFTLGKIVVAMFPGGSITGAPKKRVMQVLNKLEKANRGFYCGSTVLLFKNKKSASINIRSLEYSFEDCGFKYSAGGGITLLSDMNEEFEEMKLKTSSFLDLLSQGEYDKFQTSP